MAIEEVRAAAERERVLFAPCNHCANACMALDRLIEAIDATGLGLTLELRDGRGAHFSTGTGSALKVDCDICHGHRRVLTEAGKELVRLIPPEILAELALDKEIPF